MELSAENARIDTRQVEDNTADINISLDLQTFDILDQERIADDLKERKEEIRAQIFRVAAEEIVPGLVVKSGVPVEAPEQWKVGSTYEINSLISAQEPSENIINTRHKMGMNFHFQADQVMNPTTMLSLGRGQVASAMADNIVHSLEQRYLGKKVSDVSSEFSMDGDTVENFQVRENQKNAEQMLPNRDVQQEAGEYENVPPEYGLVNDALIAMEKYGLADHDRIRESLTQRWKMRGLLREAERALKKDLVSGDGYTYDMGKVSALFTIRTAKNSLLSKTDQKYEKKTSSTFRPTGTILPPPEIDMSPTSIRLPSDYYEKKWGKAA